MQTRISLLVDHATGNVAIQADAIPAQGQDALFFLMRVLAAAQNVVCDQLEGNKLLVAKQFKPMLNVKV